MTTLVINADDSRCGNCGRAADPRETRHFSVLGWNPDVGCGHLFTAIGSEYSTPIVVDGAKRLRPDLPWEGVGYFHFVDGRRVWTVLAEPVR